MYHQITKRIRKDLFKEDNIEIICLSDELDEKLLNIVINSIRKEIYGTEWRIFFNKNRRNNYINQCILNGLSKRELIKLIKKAFDRLSYANKNNRYN